MSRRVLLTIKGFVACMLAAFALAGCTPASPRLASAELGDGLAAWEFTDVKRTLARLPEDAAEQGLVAMYTTSRTLAPDLYVYHYPRQQGQTLEEFARAQAAALNVTCVMTSANGIPAANYAYSLIANGRPCIARAYVFEGDEGFVRACIVHKTLHTRVCMSDLAIWMMAEYEGTLVELAQGYYEARFVPTTEGLPRIWIDQYAKMGATLDDVLATATLEHELVRGEIYERNGLTVAFVGYREQGDLVARAFIDHGDDFIAITARDDEASFQHVVNALIDTITPIGGRA